MMRRSPSVSDSRQEFFNLANAINNLSGTNVLSVYVLLRLLLLSSVFSFQQKVFRHDNIFSNEGVRLESPRCIKLSTTRKLSLSIYPSEYRSGMVVSSAGGNLGESEKYKPRKGKGGTGEDSKRIKMNKTNKMGDQNKNHKQSFISKQSINSAKLKAMFRQSCYHGEINEACRNLQRIWSGRDDDNKVQITPVPMSDRDVHLLMNMCTSYAHVTPKTLKTARRLLLLHHRINTINRQPVDKVAKANSIGLSMVLRGCGFLRDTATILDIYKTLFTHDYHANEQNLITTKKYGLPALSDLDSSSTSSKGHITPSLEPLKGTIQSDIILCNSMLNSLVSCDLHAEASQFFYSMLLENNEDPITMAFVLRISGISSETAASLSLIAASSDAQNDDQFFRGSKLLPNGVQNSRLPKPNQRTYNIFLKGLTKRLLCNPSASSSKLPDYFFTTSVSESVDSKIKTSSSFEHVRFLAQHMGKIGMWDAVTTNTVVNACVYVRRFDLAEQILDRYTVSCDELLRGSSSNKGKKNQHPNVEAYTELFDGYSKENLFNEGRNVLRKMKDRRVNPSGVTYTAIIHALAREGKVDLMKKKLEEYMAEQCATRSDYDHDIAPIYNAIFAGLLLDPTTTSGDAHSLDYNSRLRHAIEIFSSLMRKSNSDRQAPRPNIVSTNILFQGLARYCSNWANSRQKYAELATKLYQELINMDYVPYGNARIHTPLMTIYASTGNLNKVKSCFSSIRDKDVVALNGYLDACTQCGSIGEALNAFRKYVGFSADKQEHDKEKSDYDEKIAIAPDVITYTVLISSILRSIHAIADGISDSTEDSSSQAHNSAKMAQAVVIVTKRSILLYNDMTTRWNIVPDNGFVDRYGCLFQ